MKKQIVILNYISTLIIFILLILPILFFNNKSTVSQNEKRDLAKFPVIINDGKININIFEEFNKYISDRFGFRQDLILIDNNIKYKILCDSGNENAVLGKNNWIYYISKDDGDNFKDFLKINLVDIETAEEFADLIKSRQVWCENNNIKFVFLIAPNKHNTYPENYIIDRPLGITRTQQFVNSMEKRNINYIYPLNELIMIKKVNNVPLYYETDTHWNQLGAFISFKLLYKSIREKLPNFTFPFINFTYSIKRNSYEGDLTKMLGLNSFGTITKINFSPDKSDWQEYYKYLKNNGRDGIITQNVNKDLPKAIIFRDSYFTSLVPFTSSIFSYVDYRWKFFEEQDKQWIIKEKPNVIIWEVAERYSNNIINYSFNE